MMRFVCIVFLAVTALGWFAVAGSGGLISSIGVGNTATVVANKEDSGSEVTNVGVGVGVGAGTGIALVTIDGATASGWAGLETTAAVCSYQTPPDTASTKSKPPPHAPRRNMDAGLTMTDSSASGTVPHVTPALRPVLDAEPSEWRSSRSRNILLITLTIILQATS
ncbi:MAG: hypothetical protein GW928_09870 [Rhodoferax sp.]|nr:hypothetical protein [Rhodoferax sp.]